jgi:hypothetical protein
MHIAGKLVLNITSERKKAGKDGNTGGKGE